MSALLKSKAKLAKRLDVLERLLNVKTTCPTCGQIRPPPPEQQQLQEVITELRAVCSEDA